MIASRWLRLGAVASALSLGCGDVPNAPDGALPDGTSYDAATPTDLASPLDASLDAPTPSCVASSCAAGYVCCTLNGRCYDPSSHAQCESPDGGSASDVTLVPADRACTSNSECPSDDYCAGESCGAPGRCVDKPTGCTMVSVPVCGCDGYTYTNACLAAASGARIAQSGGCTTVRDASVDVSADASAVCALCSVGTTCCDRPGSPAYGTCYDPMCRACCTPVAGADASVPPADARPGDCITNADCMSPQSYCAGVGCGLRGSCEPKPLSCAGVFDPVCGCDGRTYSNPCEANYAGIRVGARGACIAPPVDAGITRDAPAADIALSLCASIRCAVGTVCCDRPGILAYGTCYDARCTTCCR